MKGTIKKIWLVLFVLPLFVFPARAETSHSPLQEPYRRYTLTPGKPGGRLVIAVANDPKSFNPVVAQETSTNVVTDLIFEGLVYIHPLTMEVMPGLAEHWQSSNGGREWIFYLRRGARWNDGMPVTAADVVFTFNELVYNDDIPTSSRDIFTIDDKKITVEKIDDYTVRFKLPATFGPFLRAMAQEILPWHKYRAAVREKKFTFSLGLDTSPDEIVGSGPFRLKEYRPGERIVFERNPYYWKKDAAGARLPYLNEIIYLIAPGADATLLRFLDREIDYCALKPRDLSLLGPQRESGNFTIYDAGPSFNENFLVFNQTPGLNPLTQKPFVAPHKREWFVDREFRRAVAYAINRKKIIDIIYNDLGEEEDSPLTPANRFFYNPVTVKYPYDPARARQILDSLGMREGDADGFRRDSSGNRLEINFYTNADNDERVQTAALVKTDLEAVGIKVNFLPLDFNNLVAKLSATRDWEAVLMGFTGGLEPHFGKNVWSYHGTLHVWNRSGQAIAPFEQEIEDIFNKAARSTNEKERKRFYDRWQYLVSQELPLIHLAVPRVIYAVRNRFGNLYPTVYGGAFGELDQVYVKE